MYTKTITPAFEHIGKRKRLTGYLAELHDGNILLYSCEYDTNSQAEKVLDSLVFELLTDLADQGLVDDVPAAMEAEHVSSTHLPGWLIEAQTIHPTPICADPDCQGPHHTYQCPAIRAQLFAEDVDYDTKPYQPLGWCYICGSAAWTTTQFGFLCPSHSAVLDEMADPVVVMVVDVEFAPVGWAA